MQTRGVDYQDCLAAGCGQERDAAQASAQSDNKSTKGRSMSLRNHVGRAARSCLRFLLAISTAFVFASGAAAQNLGTIFTDLWYTVGEDGWGVTVDHQQNVMFLTFFIYRADGSPYWVTAVLNKVGTGGLASTNVFSGTVYEDHGPWFGGPFNSANVVETTVGTATFTAPSHVAASLQYSINGTNVTKIIHREALSFINYSSAYRGGTTYTLSNCQNPAMDGTTIVDTGTLTINQSGTAFAMTAVGQTTNCTFSGAYSQRGSIGQVDGTFACTDSTLGTFTLYALQWTLFGMSAGITLTSQFCYAQGYLGGITANHFVP
jgi:hypothetical protein